MGPLLGTDAISLTLLCKMENGRRTFLAREKDETKLASDRFNREALAELLRKTNEKTGELYGVWDGNFLESPKVRESISIERILESDFWFKEQGFYTITIGNEPSARPEILKS